MTPHEGSIILSSGKNTPCCLPPYKAPSLMADNAMKSALTLCLLLSLAIGVPAAEPVLELDAGNLSQQARDTAPVTEWKSSNGTISVTQANPEHAPVSGTKLNGRSTLFFLSLIHI